MGQVAAATGKGAVRQGSTGAVEEEDGDGSGNDVSKAAYLFGEELIAVDEGQSLVQIRRPRGGGARVVDLAMEGMAALVVRCRGLVGRKHQDLMWAEGVGRDCGRRGLLLYVSEEVDNKVPARLTEKAGRLLQNDDAVEG
ncbi:hypothetical protein GW17_00014246 [Ensete ventricosum]|nr:hypothetical protein GW17_00014246 [Ensete ventricosum]